MILAALCLAHAMTLEGRDPETIAAALIRDDRGHQLVSAIQTGKADGMITLEASLARLVAADLVERSIALATARDRAQLSTLLSAR